MKLKIALVTGSRAEFGLLKKLIHLLDQDSSFDLFLIVTGSHLASSHGLTINEIEDEGLNVYAKVDLELEGKESSVAHSTSIGINKFSTLWKDIKPDLLMVLGDRYEILSAVLAACFENIPIGHIHGGETTEGSIDEAIRHSITKFSHLHFVAAQEYKNRVIQLGEIPSNVFLVGGMGIDSINDFNIYSKQELNDSLGINFLEKNLLVTYHPVTLEPWKSSNELSNILRSLQKLNNTAIIFTLPNADSGNKDIVDLIETFVRSSDNYYRFASVGQGKYFSLLKIVDAVVGNSSSGLTEVPYFNKPTINIGSRQAGRLKAKSVIDCPGEELEIDLAISKIYKKKEFKENLFNHDCPYGKPGASQKIYEIIKSHKIENILTKKFHDIELS